jgi:hypothetical protein
VRVGPFGLLALVSAVAASASLAAASGPKAPAGPMKASEWPLTIVAFATYPNRPKAGGLFTAAMGIMDETTGEALDSGEVHCRGRIGSRLVHLVHKQFVPDTGVAGCIWRIPTQTGGKRFYGRITVISYDGTQVTKKFSRPIRP